MFMRIRSRFWIRLFLSYLVVILFGMAVLVGAVGLGMRFAFNRQVIPLMMNSDNAFPRLMGMDPQRRNMSLEGLLYRGFRRGIFDSLFPAVIAAVVTAFVTSLFFSRKIVSQYRQ